MTEKFFIKRLECKSFLMHFISNEMVKMLDGHLIKKIIEPYLNFKEG